MGVKGEWGRMTVGAGSAYVSEKKRNLRSKPAPAIPHQPPMINHQPLTIREQSITARARHWDQKTHNGYRSDSPNASPRHHQPTTLD